MNIQHYLTALECYKLDDFIKTHHYLKSLSRGNKHCFVLYENNIITGAALFGSPVGPKVNDKYGGNILELKRFVMIDGKNNRCSQFLGACIRWLKKHTDYDKIISYADPEQGHEGTIYKATNFSFFGFQKYTTPYIMYKGKKIYARNIYGKNKTDIKILKWKKENNKKIKYAEPKSIFIYSLSVNDSNGSKASTYN
jgi:hypothetical protein